ncbi:DUF742 domain-containing protein [Plantactinospora solaniradicis]|uniref:DUF742 domain-containing protein n=1 Tax=Plantactinospora solaniradicis TaxID=1723736 RepID=A0ABW1KLI0_9ACTN
MADGWSGDDERDEPGLVPLYVLVHGRTRPRNSNLDLATQVIALPADISRLEPEYADIVNQCASWMSIAEIGAYLRRPLTIVKVMVDVLVEQRFLKIGSPAQQQVADLRLMETVLAGLQRL